MCSFQCTVGKRKHLWFLLRGPATYCSHLRRTSITLPTSPFTLILASRPYRSLFVQRRKGERGNEVLQTKVKGRIVAFSLRGRRVEVEWPLFDGGGKEERNGVFHQEEKAARGLLISLEEERATNRTNSFVPPDGVCCIVTGSCCQKPAILHLASNCESTGFLSLVCCRLRTHKLLTHTRASCGSWPHTLRWCAGQRWQRVRKGGKWRQPGDARRGSLAAPAGLPGS